MAPGRTVLSCLLAVGLAACGQRQPAAGPAAAPPAAAAGAVAAGSATPASARAGGPFITLSPDNVHIEYHLYGQGEPAVILVHGWACDANYWQAQIAALGAHYTVVAVNLAGHGASGANRSDWSIANYAQDVAAVARQIPNKQLVLVGHSMGAAVVLAATPLLGDRVIGIIAVEALRSVGEPPLAAREIERRVAPFSADFIGATRRLVSDSLFEQGADRVLVQKVAYDMSLEPQAVAVASLRALLSTDLTALAPAVHVPVYAINSDLLPTDAARIRKSLPDFTLDVLDHSGHFLMLEAPARFNPLLLRDVAAIVQRASH
ncbi:MAG TPA: alpha/beta hydrolase [Steroidobacteraceae bacterium]|nr:alpha/beta hydrolase [Steroidobacteraceae bacterium]